MKLKQKQNTDFRTENMPDYQSINEPTSHATSDDLIQDGDGRIDRLLEIMRRLRDPETGCPWDVKQTHASLTPYVVEEAYEVVEAIERGGPADLRDELGDLLLQVTLHAQIASETGAFGFADIVRAVSDKLVRRHPHVFADADADDWDWEALKAEERREMEAEPGRARPVEIPSLLDDVPRAAPALLVAEKLQRRAAKVGFDWPTAERVLDKLREETEELVEAQHAGADPDRLEDELGDMLFVMANLARRLKVDPEVALRRSNEKFRRRFRAIELALAARGIRPADSTLEEMDAEWSAAKAKERAND